MVARRFFRCDCGHKVRFGAHYCGKCHQETVSANRLSFWVVPGIAAVGILLIAAMIIGSLL